MFAAIRAIEYHLPERTLTNQELSALFPDWSAAKISDKTGIDVRHIAAPDECASDLAAAAARKLFDTGVCPPSTIDYLLFCTQSPDYILPPTACVLQQRLDLPITAGALDFNLGCSGFVYGLSLARALIESQQAAHVLLLTADTLTRYLHPQDRGNRSLLGDAGAATLVQASQNPGEAIGAFTFGTDGMGHDHIIIRNGRARHPSSSARPDAALPSPDHFFMNGPEVFSFTLRAVPKAIASALARARISMEEVDLFVFHQANGFILENLRAKLGIPREKFVFALRESGNTSSSTIPIALKDARMSGQLKPGMRVMLVGFGVGYSWAATVMRVGD